MKLLLTATLVASLAAPAFADSVNGRVQDHYKDVVKKVPHTEYICETVEVPVYGKSGSNTGDRIAGAIIGGVIGNQIGKGKGNTAATVIGAITGSELAGSANTDKVVGYRQEERCSNRTTYQTERYNVYSHSTIEFYENGKQYKLRFTR